MTKLHPRNSLSSLEHFDYCIRRSISSKKLVMTENQELLISSELSKNVGSKVRIFTGTKVPIVALSQRLLHAEYTQVGERLNK